MKKMLRVFAVSCFCMMMAPAVLFSQNNSWETLYGQAGRMLDSGKYRDGISVARKALRAAETTFGSKHEAVALSLNLLAYYYVLQGDFWKAESLVDQALAIKRDEPSILMNQAIVYAEEGKFQQAETAAHRAIDLSENRFGEQDGRVAESLSTLAEVYRIEGKLDSAEPIYQRALALWRRTLSEDHPNIIRTLGNLGSVYAGLGDELEAERLLKQVLSAQESTLSSDHPQLALSLRELGKFYMGQGDFDQAETLLNRALDIQEKSLGRDHAETAGTVARFAQLYQLEGKLDEAESFYRRALKIYEKIYGPQNIYFLALKSNMELLSEARK